MREYVDKFTQQTYVNKKGKTKENSSYNKDFADIITNLDARKEIFTFTDDPSKLSNQDILGEINVGEGADEINIIVPSWSNEAERINGGRAYALFEEVFHASQYASGDIVKTDGGLSAGVHTTNVLNEANAKIFAADRVGNTTYSHAKGSFYYNVDTWAGLIRSSASNPNRVTAVATMLVQGVTKTYTPTGSIEPKEIFIKSGPYRN